jgi:cytochrome c553
LFGSRDTPILVPASVQGTRSTGEEKLRQIVLLLAFALLPAKAFALDPPDWAFPVTEKNAPPVKDDGLPKHVPNSAKAYTQTQIDDGFNPPDWLPDIHPPMPQVVAHGEGTDVRGCALCHLPTGTGHDESANLAGLPANYLIEQMADYKSGARKGSGTMTGIGKVITDEDVRAAAAYFSGLKPRPWIRVVETATVPKTFVGAGNKRLPSADGATEPIGSRIIEIPEVPERVLDRDPQSGFVAYVPQGSIARGEAIVSTGDGGKTLACAICHGPTYQGLGNVPGIAGRQASYVVRQLFDIQTGDRAGASAALMEQVAAKLSVDDMVAIAAYLASRAP